MVWVTDNTEIIIIVLTALVAILLLINIFSYAEFRKARRMYRAFMVGVDKQNLESGLLDLVTRVANLEEGRTEHRKQLCEIERNLARSIQCVSMVRFNAFNDMGGELSFALAMLDSEGTGVAVSSIYGRAEARIYAKTIVKGKSSHVLSKEEEQAIKEASKNQKTKN